MKTAYFKTFKEHIEVADKQDRVWWEGYHWIDLTAKQFKTVYHILESKGFDKSADGTIMMPSGLGIRRPEEA